MKELRIARKMIVTLIKDRLQYRGRLLVDTVSTLSRCGLLLLLYWYVFQLNNGVVNGTTFIYSAWSIFFYFSFLIFRLRNISDGIMYDVKTGNVEVLFNKPVSYLLYRIWWQIGSGLYSFVVISFLGIIVLGLLLGFPSTMQIWLFVPTYLLTLLCGSILTLLIYIIIGLLAFWIEDVNPVIWIVDKAIMILGGSYLSVALFPDIMYKIAVYSPFGASQLMSHTVLTPWQTNWYYLVGVQFVWILLLGVVVYLMFGKAKQNVSVNGG